MGNVYLRINQRVQDSKQVIKKIQTDEVRKSVENILHDKKTCIAFANSAYLMRHEKTRTNTK